jgi:hypothetical protein
LRRVGSGSGNLRRTRFGALFARLGVFLVALALLSQSLAAAAPPMSSGGDARSAARELTALLGPGVVVCTQSDGANLPDHRPADCRDSCPLCLTAAFALEAPSAAAPPTPMYVLAGALGVAPPKRSIVRPRAAFSLARGPPSPT